MEEFQYIDSHQFTPNQDFKPDTLGPTFHLKPHCPICDSCYSDLYCSDCVRKGTFSTVSKSEESQNFSSLTCRSSAINKEIVIISSRIFNKKKLLISNTDNKNIICKVHGILNLRQFTDVMKNSIAEKKRKVCKINDQMSKYHACTEEIRRSLFHLKHHMNDLNKWYSSQLEKFIRVNKQLNNVRTSRLVELLSTYFPTVISNVDNVDTIAGIPLNIDKSKPLSGPEPTTSSHAALANAVVASKTAAQLFDVWLPPSTRKLLRLSDFFAGDFPCRDDLARVHTAVSQTIQIICTVCGLASISSKDLAKFIPPEDRNASKHEANLLDVRQPLTGLHILSIFAQNRQFTRHFDEPYIFARLDLLDEPCISAEERSLSEVGRANQGPCQSGAEDTNSQIELLESPCRDLKRTSKVHAFDNVTHVNVLDSAEGKWTDSEDEESISPDWEIVVNEQLDDSRYT